MREDISKPRRCFFGGAQIAQISISMLGNYDVGNNIMTNKLIDH